MVKVKMWSDAGSGSREASLSTTVKELKEQLCLDTGSIMSELEVVFCGRRLVNDSVLSSFDGMRDHSTVYVLKRKLRTKSSEEEQPNLDPAAVDALVTSFHTALMDPQHRSLLFSIISNAEGLSSLISATPGLKEDTVVQGILKDPYLLVHWLTSENVSELIKSHPCLVEAGQQIMTSLHQEAASLGVDRSSMLYVQASDDEDNSDAEGDNAQGGGDNEAAGGAAITTDQLAAALAAAGAPPNGGNVAAPSPSRPPPSREGRVEEAASSSSRQLPPPISTDAFQRAMLEALGRQQPPPTHQPQPEVDISEGMVQLRDMGFTNQEENRRALLANGGNFEAALEFIISERERMEGEMGLD